MKIIALFFACIILVFGVTQETSGQKLKLPASYPKGTLVVPKFSAKLVTFQKQSVWSGRVSYQTRIEKDSNGYSLSGDAAWRERGWPVMDNFTVEKIGKEDGTPVIELRSMGANLKVEISSSVSDLEAALNEIFFVGHLEGFKRTAYYRKEVIDRFLPKIFAGRLSELDEEFKLNLITGVKYNAEAVSGEEFKGKFYLALNLGLDDVYYNTNQVNQSERTARTIERILNAGVKQGAQLKKYPSIDGLKLTVQVGYADFLREGRYPAHKDELQSYFLIDALSEYQNADITNQQLIDKSIILVNGNRVQVSLTQFN